MNDDIEIVRQKMKNACILANVEPYELIAGLVVAVATLGVSAGIPENEFILSLREDGSDQSLITAKFFESMICQINESN